MSGAEIVADCDAMTFALVHHKLRAQVDALLDACGWRVVTLDAVYRHEAQDALRGELDALVAKGRCERVEHPARRDLDKKQLKLWHQIDQLAQRRFKFVSPNDRALLFEATDRGILLVSEDGPLRALADERGQVVLDVLDLVAILHARGAVQDERHDDLLGREAQRLKVNKSQVTATLAARGRSHWPCAA